MELRPINKKGQGLTSSTLILLVVGVIVMVIVVLGFTKGWNFFTDLFNTGSIDMEAISQKCGLLASTGGGGYCTDRIEIGKDKYINCKHAVDNLGAKVENAPSGGCSGASKQICEKLKLEGDNFDESKVEVNGGECSDLLSNLPEKTCIGLKGNWADKCKDKEEDSTTGVGKTDRDKNKNKKCCVAP